MKAAIRKYSTHYGNSVACVGPRIHLTAHRHPLARRFSLVSKFVPGATQWSIGWGRLTLHPWSWMETYFPKGVRKISVRSFCNMQGTSSYPWFCVVLLNEMLGRINYPEIQSLAFEKIFSSTVLWPKLRQTFKDVYAVNGESLQSAVGSWKRPGVCYTEEWLRLFDAASHCLTPNPVIDFMGRSICRYKISFSHRFRILLLSCRWVCNAVWLISIWPFIRNVTDEMLVLRTIGLNWKQNCS